MRNNQDVKLRISLFKKNIRNFDCLIWSFWGLVKNWINCSIWISKCTSGYLYAVAYAGGGVRGVSPKEKRKGKREKKKGKWEKGGKMKEKRIKEREKEKKGREIENKMAENR